MTTTDPQARHQTALDAIDQQIATAQAATPGPWRMHDTDLGRLGGHTATVLSGEGNATDLRAWLPSRSGQPWDTTRNVWNDARFIAANDPTTALAQLEGRRRILQRHPPDPEFEGPACGHPGCFAVGANWPCPDWLDAAAGLEDRP